MSRQHPISLALACLLALAAPLQAADEHAAHRQAHHPGPGPARGRPPECDRRAAAFDFQRHSLPREQRLHRLLARGGQRA